MVENDRDLERPVSSKAYFLLAPAWAIAGTVFIVAQRYFWTSPQLQHHWELVPRATLVFIISTACLYKPLLSWLEISGHRRRDSSAVALVMVGTLTYFIPFMLAFPEAGPLGFIPSYDVAPFHLACAASGFTFAA